MEEIRLLYHSQSILGWTERSAPTQHVLQPKTRAERERCKKKEELLDVNNPVNQQFQPHSSYRCGGASFCIGYKYHPPLSGEVSELQAHMEWESTENMAHSVRRRDQAAKGFFVIPNKTEWSYFMTEKILRWNDAPEWTDEGDDVMGSLEPGNHQEFNDELEYSDDD